MRQLQWSGMLCSLREECTEQLTGVDEKLVSDGAPQGTRLQERQVREEERTQMEIKENEKSEKNGESEKCTSVEWRDKDSMW